MNWLISLGLDDYPGAPYPLSPYVHWWHDGRLEQVSGLVPGHPASIGADEFLHVFEGVLGCSVEDAADQLDEQFARERRQRDRRTRSKQRKRR